MKEIPIYIGRIEKPITFAIVDDEDYEYVNQYKWTFGNGGYPVTRSDRKNLGNHVSMHKLVLVNSGNIPGKGMVIDHINGNPLDNRRSENLRIVSQRENSLNRSSNNEYPGVRIYNNNLLYYATLSTENRKKIYHDKSFITQQSAQIAYRIMSNKICEKTSNFEISKEDLEIYSINKVRLVSRLNRYISTYYNDYTNKKYYIAKKRLFESPDEALDFLGK